MAQRPNWFDREFGGEMETATAEAALAEIAKSQRLIREVQTALDANDAEIKKARDAGHVFAGPTRSQIVRKVVAEVLQAQD